MKISNSIFFVLGLGGVLVFLIYQSFSHPIDDELTEERTIDVVQPADSRSTIVPDANIATSEYLIETPQSSRFVETGDGTIMLTIPSGELANTEWKTVDELKSDIPGLEEELKLTIDEQSEEFRVVDVRDYNDFLDSLGLDSGTQQNILAQLIDSNRAGFTRMLHHAVELQSNGYVAWITDPNRDNGYFDFIAESSPAAVMGRNLDPDQLESFYDFEASRQSQKPASPDYIAKFVERVGL